MVSAGRARVHSLHLAYPHTPFATITDLAHLQMAYSSGSINADLIGLDAIVCVMVRGRSIVFCTHRSLSHEVSAAYVRFSFACAASSGTKTTLLRYKDYLMFG